MTSEFSKGDVRRAGRLLRDQHHHVTDELLQAFRIVHEWRASHLAPMRSVRQSLSSRARAHDPVALSAGRLKRMKSVRRKLRREPADLTELQDLGGCRAILPTLAACREVASDLIDTTVHQVQRQRDYITEPRPSGYRSHHIVLKFQSGDLANHGRFVEVQLRTQLQHAWATALEAVGLVRGEDLKAGEGNAAWLRFFALMSGEIAQREGCATPCGVPSDCADRRREIKDAVKALKAIDTLDSYRRAIHASTSFNSIGAGGMFIIKYDPNSRSVAVDRTSKAPSDSYRRAEETSKGIETVLVEVDRAADLRAAYPNYYLDVDDFLAATRDALWDVPMVSSDVPNASPAQQSQHFRGWRPDFSWLNDWRKK